MGIIKSNKETLDAIKAKTDNLPTDPADQSAVEAAITSAHSATNGKIDTVDTVVDAIKTKTDDLIPNITPTSGTYAHPSGTTEQDAIVLSISTRTKINNIYLDLTNLTQNCTIRVKAKIDGTNYREIDSLGWTTADRDGVIISEFVSDVAAKVTIQSAVAEGASRNIPYRVV
jgi:hypothetical protein